MNTFTNSVYITTTALARCNDIGLLEAKSEATTMLVALVGKTKDWALLNPKDISGHCVGVAPSLPHIASICVAAPYCTASSEKCGPTMFPLSWFPCHPLAVQCFPIAPGLSPWHQRVGMVRPRLLLAVVLALVQDCKVDADPIMSSPTFQFCVTADTAGSKVRAWS